MLHPGDVVTINAIVPTDYTETNWTGNTSCSTTTDVGNTYYKVKHEYSVEDWSVENTTNQSITYTVGTTDTTVTANIKDTTSQVDKYQCTSSDATYHEGYYYCDSGDSRSGTTCYYTYTTTSGYHAGSCSCNSGDTLSGTTCKYEDVIYDFDCPAGYSDGYDLDGSPVCIKTGTYDATCTSAYCDSGTVSGSRCRHTSPYSAHYSSPYYTCSTGTLDGSKCIYTTGL